jgi:8-oxo-dGTP pyrophosphatase MutT (NUDIX family)
VPEWPAHVTVATVVEQDGRFLLVEERSPEGLVINQPAGHLEPGETLVEAALRETLEETGWVIELCGVVGLALYTAPGNGVTYYRTTFYGRPLRQQAEHELDEGIERALWLNREEMAAESARMRSPLVLAAVDAYLRGHRWPLDIFYYPE